MQKIHQDLLDKMYELLGGRLVQYTIPKEHIDDVSCMARGGSWLNTCHTEPQDQLLMHSMVDQGLWDLCLVNE